MSATPSIDTGRPTLFILDGSLGVTGAFVAARRQAESLAGLVDCILVLSQKAEIPPEALAAFARIVRLPTSPLRRAPASVAAYPLATLRSSRLLAAELRRNRGARLQVNDYFLLEGALTRLFGFKGTIATWVRIDPAHYGGPVARIWLEAARRASGRLIAVSRFIQRRLPPGTVTELLYDPAPKVPLAVPPVGQRLVLIGNYIDGKGQDLAIRAFHRVAGRFPSAELVCHGGTMGLARNQDYREMLKRLAAEGAGAGRIRLEEFVTDTGAALDGASAALTLSRSESFSFTCQEASARGLAVIATRCGGPEEIVEPGATGWLVPVDDVEATAKAMAEALSDPVEARRRGLAGAALMRERFGAAAFLDALSYIFALDLSSRGQSDGIRP